MLRRSGILTLVEVSPDVDDKDEGEKDGPTGECTGTAGKGSAVKEECANEKGPEDL